MYTMVFQNSKSIFTHGIKGKVTIACNSTIFVDKLTGRREIGAENDVVIKQTNKYGV